MKYFSMFEHAKLIWIEGWMGKVCFLFLDKCQAIEKEKNVLLKVCKEENNMESFKGTKQTLFNEGS